MPELTDLEVRKAQYEAKRAARYERLLAAAARAERESSGLLDQAHRMAEVIPFGQPILVGHYSEGRDRRYRGRIENKYRKGFELAEHARELRSRAESAASNNAISSDDPTAIDQLQAKVAELEELQATYKRVNAAYKKFLKDPASLDTSDLKESWKNSLRTFKPDWHGDQPIPSYRLTNNNANIRRVKERIQLLEKRAQDVTTESTTNGVTITDNVEDNRLQISFPGKPSDECRAELKSHGFRWTPSAGVWQAFRGPNARYYAEQIVKKFYGGTPS